MTYTNDPNSSAIVEAACHLLLNTHTTVLHEEEIARATGSRFNLFQILGVGHYEVTTHSQLLADLFDPKGRHGQGSVFLQLFLSILQEKSSLTIGFDAASANVRCEVGIGPRTETEGGRLDILITDRVGRAIAIENKIYAVEQDNWVERYLGFLKRRKEGGHLVYLTLHEDVPQACADSKKVNEVICISYASTITAWLEACRKEAATAPIVRESLTQYLHLIHDLTNQNTSNRMNDAIINSVLGSKLNYQAFRALKNAEQAVRKRIIFDLGQRLRGGMSSGFTIDALPEGNGSADESFLFSTPELKALGLSAAIAFEKNHYGDCFVGFRVLDFAKPMDIGSPLIAILAGLFKEEFGHPESTGNWPAWHWWDQRREWGDDVLETIFFDKTQFDQELKEIIDSLFHVTAQLVAITGGEPISPTPDIASS